MNEHNNIKDAEIVVAPVSRTIRIFRALVAIAVVGALAFFVQGSLTKEDTKYPFKYGLDLEGGVHLVYTADISNIAEADVKPLMGVLRAVIERRVNLFGVGEPIVYTETAGAANGESHQRLIVELPGVTDVAAAIKQIGSTPNLEFLLVNEQSATLAGKREKGETLTEVETLLADNPFITTGLTGRYIKRAELQFGGTSGGGLSNEPLVSVTFSDEGKDLFGKITSEHVNERLAIFLDGNVISMPVINEAILGGSATISGGFVLDEAKTLVDNLNFGALPMPVALESTQVIDATLGADVLAKGVEAGLIGLALVASFLLLWYRAAGIVSIVGLSAYMLIMLALFVFIPVTLTAAGIAGFILSIGMAVDANVLVFERFKEEFRAGSSAHDALRIGFSRAWSAIRDGNITTILAALVLYWFGTSFVQGFAFVLILGTLVSMFSALVVTRIFAHLLPDTKHGKGVSSLLLGSGITK